MYLFSENSSGGCRNVKRSIQCVRPAKRQPGQRPTEAGLFFQRFQNVVHAVRKTWVERFPAQGQKAGAGDALAGVSAAASGTRRGPEVGPECRAARRGRRRFHSAAWVCGPLHCRCRGAGGGACTAGTGRKRRRPCGCSSSICPCCRAARLPWRNSRRPGCSVPVRRGPPDVRRFPWRPERPVPPGEEDAFFPWWG